MQQNVNTSSIYRDDNYPCSFPGTTTILVCVHSRYYQTSIMTLSFSPRSSYYFWKALMPLYLLTGLSMSTFHFDTDNLADRNATVLTWIVIRILYKRIKKQVRGL